MIAKSHQWQLTAVAIAALSGFWVTDAAALSLGRVTIQSALGEPLRAEIDVLSINAEEASTLSTRVASPEAFKAAGLEYNPALSNLQATLQRRAGGNAYIRLRSDRVINDPFVDLILEANWNTGRIVRDYTLLLDPPNLKLAETLAPVAAQTPVAIPEPAVPAAPVAVRQPETLREVPRERQPVPQPKPATPVVKVAPAPKAAPTTAGGATVKVNAGDTAGRIASVNKPANVSLDQMLVALLRANPSAFVNDNVNRIKAGAILTLPTEAEATQTPPSQARQDIIAQSQDFNDFRRKFASNVPATELAPAGRDVSGKIQATVEDKKSATATPDKLTLSKGTVQGKSGEDQLAKANNAKAASDRAAELAKNINELGKLAAASASAAPTVAASAVKPGLPLAVAAPASSVAAVASSMAAPVSQVAPASAPVAAAPIEAPSAPAKPASAAPIAPVAEPESSFLDSLLENPWLPSGVAGLVVLLAGLGFYKVRQRKKSSELDSAFVDSKVRADAFSGVSGGQSVDTSDNLVTGSSMIYSPSQLDAVDDVDPVAEADVYLAYGRDLQAEEILKDALRTNPQRVAIHQKLLEIYAKRGEPKAFESIAALAFNLTDGTGPQWEQICEKGLSIDPDNALYLPGGQPLAEFNSATMPAKMAVRAELPAEEETAPDQLPVPAAEDGSIDLDLDLDFSLEEPAAPQAESTLSETALPVSDFSISTDDEKAAMSLELDASLNEMLSQPVELSEPEPTLERGFEHVTAPDSLAGKLDFPDSLPELDLLPAEDDMVKTQAMNASEAETSPAPLASGESDMMKFDLGSLSLDLGNDPVTEPGAFVDESQDPLETKLALADEFRAIGDDDGARALIEEVIAEASGAMKAKAERALSNL